MVSPRVLQLSGVPRHAYGLAPIAAALAIAILVLFPVCDFIWLAALIGSMPFALALVRGAKDLMRPSVVIPLIYSLYAVGPMLIELGYSEHVRSVYGLTHLIGVLSLMIGLAVGEGASVDLKRRVSLSSRDLAALRLTILVLLFLGLVSIATQAAAFGGIPGLLAVGYGVRHFEVLRDARTFGAGFDWWLLACCLLTYLAFATRRCRLALIAICVALPVLLLLLRIGGRSTLVYVALFAFVVFHEGWRRLHSGAVFLSFVGGLILAQFYSLARYFLDTGIWNALRSTIQIAQNAPWALLPTASNEFRAPSAALLDVLQFASAERWDGRSYLDAATSAIPGISNLFGEVEVSPSIWRLRELYPDVLSAGGGLGFSPAAEGWLNFGPAGVVLHLAVYGLLIGSAYRWHRSRASVVTLLLLAGMLPMFALDGLRIHAGAFIYKTTRVYLMPLFVFLIARDLLRLADHRVSKPNGERS